MLVVGERRRLARRAADDDAVGAVRTEVAQQLDERVLVDAQVVVERRHDRREDGPQIRHAGDRISPVRRVPCGPVPELTVEVTAVRYALEEGDFAVLAGVSDEGEEVVLTGALAHVHAGESVDVSGDWRRHPRHGPQFAVERVRVREPSGEAAVLAYLNSIKHVGMRGATWLVDRHGVAAAAAALSYPALGPGSIEMLQTAPYATTEVEGIGFATADALARALGTPPDAPSRIAAGLLHALHQAEGDGHCHLPREEALARAWRLLGTDAEDRLDELTASGKLVEEDGRVSDPVMYAIERRL